MLQIQQKREMHLLLLNSMLKTSINSHQTNRVIHALISVTKSLLYLKTSS